MTPNAPSATDSGLTASSTWAATTEVAWISYAAPGGRVRMNSCSTVRATPLPRSSWSPYSTGAAAAGDRPTTRRMRAGVNTMKPYARSMSSWTTWLSNTTIPTNLARTRRRGITSGVPKPACSVCALV